MLLSPVYVEEMGASYVLSNGFFEPILLNWIAMNSPLESRSFTMGIYETVFGLGMIVGPMAAGLVTNSYPSAWFTSC